MDFLEGKAAIVTGAGGGIGRAEAMRLAAYGAKVLVNDLGVALDGSGSDRRPAEEVVAEINAAGGEAVANFEDVSSWEGAKRMVQQAIDVWGRLDMLVNNAGIVRDRIIWNMSEEDWDAVIRVHLKGTFCPTRHAVAYWRERFKAGERVSGARIINTTSGAMLGNPGQANYGAAKGGIASFTLTVAVEVQGMGITCNAIRPTARTRISATANPALTAGMPEAPPQDFDPQDPVHVGEVVAYLASDAAQWISGQVIKIMGNRIELNKGWHVVSSIEKPGAAWTAEELVLGMPKLAAAGPLSMAEQI
jgi:NAD(P)-dependent dehydrogenase (short-subunit alcohol dehydrogenase family)